MGAFEASNIISTFALSKSASQAVAIPALLVVLTVIALCCLIALNLKPTVGRAWRQLMQSSRKIKVATQRTDRCGRPWNFLSVPSATPALARFIALAVSQIHRFRLLKEAPVFDSVRFVATVCFMIFLPLPFQNAYAETADGWIVSQTATGLSFNTKTGIGSRKSHSMEGLVSVSSVGNRTLLRFWERGAFRPTVMIGDRRLVDGYDIDDVSRLRSLRLAKSGSLVYLRSRKGPRTTVDLVQDGKVVFQWPRQTRASIISFDADGLVISVQDSKTLSYKFTRIGITDDGNLDPDQRQHVGSLENCALLSAKSLASGIALQVFCDEEKGSDVYFLPVGEDRPYPIANSAKDEVLAYGLDRSIRGAVPVLAISGSRAGRQAFHAVSGLLLNSLGEPGALASDEAGSQSWNQTYRTTALSVLYHKTGHGVFAALADRAMRSTLDSRNSQLKVSGPHNPSCGWASRIYSEDYRTPVSLMINQAVITGSLIRACKNLGKACPVTLRQEINQTTVCLAEAQEQNFDTESQLYRIPYAINFRYDGIWAPWNWQTSWAFVLSQAARTANKPHWDRRSQSLMRRFLKSWETPTDGALWRYWPPEYFSGWTTQDRISLSKPKKKPDPEGKYEDIAHAGISLLALGETPVDGKYASLIQARLDKLLDNGFMLPRHIDGRGPSSPRWFPGAGWDAFATDTQRKRYEKLVPGGAAGDRLLAYADLYDPNEVFQLDLELLSCRSSNCAPVREWHFDSVEKYLVGSPLFSIQPAID